MIDERISFLKEQINPENKPEVNSAFQLQIDAIRSVDDLVLPRISEYPFLCWRCMIVDAVSETASQYL